MQLSLFDTQPRVLTVSGITAYIRQKLENDLTLQDLWLEGEISNWKPAASGHIYFTLKDAAASVRCVIWRSQVARLEYTPRRDGEAVLAHGKISVYEAGGNYQFYVDNLKLAGLGALYAEFERIKARLEAEGLFDPARKRPLPAFPRHIGVVTSPDGAALRDILNVLRRRFPLAHVTLSPTQVQGDAAPAQIVAALHAISRRAVDVIIIARGGGSLEDLWAFNDERLARAIAACPIPVVSGVGHEVDFTIADFVADARAPTPSAAAELVAPDRLELARLVYQQEMALVDAAAQAVIGAKTGLRSLEWALGRLSPQARINNYRQQIDAAANQAGRAMRHRLLLHREKVNALTAQLASLNPAAILNRGYAIVHKNGQVVARVGQVNPGDALTIQVSDGQFPAHVDQNS
jgi:exodeoxyribonuclease VII large subunit